jgi:hypothetical protein
MRSALRAEPNARVVQLDLLTVSLLALPGIREMMGQMFAADQDNTTSDPKAREGLMKLGLDIFSLRSQGWDAFQHLEYASQLGLDLERSVRYCRETLGIGEHKYGGA